MAKSIGIRVHIVAAAVGWNFTLTLVQPSWTNHQAPGRISKTMTDMDAQCPRHSPMEELTVREKPILIGDLQSWDLDANGDVVDQAEYEKWAAATINWSFGDSQASGGTVDG